jgi:Tfp pilus assembly protein PilN
VREIEEAEELEMDIAAINQLSRRISKIKSVQPYEFFDVLTELALLMPPGTNLTRITFSRDADSITIWGHAEQRVQVIALEDALRTSKFFGEVDAPLSNLLQPTDIDFTFTLTSIQEG